MSQPKIRDYVFVGLIGWGLPAVLVLGPKALLWVSLAVVPIWFAARGPRQPQGARGVGDEAMLQRPPLMGLMTLAAIYLVFDATLGRQKFAHNMFLTGGALETVVEQINEGVSQGRGAVDLLGAVAIFIPFALFDGARRAELWLGTAARLVGGVFLFYDVGISRGFALIAVLAISLGSGATWRRWAWASGFALALFALSSLYRGDFNDVSFSNPLFDAAAWPFINLSVLDASDCGSGSWFTFVAEFGKKFLPAFLFNKEVFSFNVEMTQCIYPFFGNYVGSVSVFTYLGEFMYYTPSWMTAIVAGLVLAALARVDDDLLARNALTSTRSFAGLMCIVLLRSRVQDVLSFLLFLLVFLLLWRLAAEAWARFLRHQGRADTDRESLAGE